MAEFDERSVLCNGDNGGGATLLEIEQWGYSYGHVTKQLSPSKSLKHVASGLKHVTGGSEACFELPWVQWGTEYVVKKCKFHNGWLLCIARVAESPVKWKQKLSISGWVSLKFGQHMAVLKDSHQELQVLLIIRKYKHWSPRTCTLYGTCWTVELLKDWIRKDLVLGLIFAAGRHLRKAQVHGEQQFRYSVLGSLPFYASSFGTIISGWFIDWFHCVDLPRLDYDEMMTISQIKKLHAHSTLALYYLGSALGNLYDIWDYWRKHTGDDLDRTQGTAWIRLTTGKLCLDIGDGGYGWWGQIINPVRIMRYILELAQMETWAANSYGP
ncbi:hypothetical protein DFH09DRAFT_1508852 [Mycena vulgaris]|nr:hypothetical protein DFH09DRAFT_1508852 [Mycena vulgaris]